ncbi:hypothetical protein [Streptomyces sp. NBC_01618]|uniref:hypothetical protein n=1 Tax=Streptomyces sp. NBC_01618 TaxID=2975900 RepID=UPI0038664ADD|nr:hypothetical protein OH735_03895 [Streptomyces sp. NBC_01618]
MTADGSVIHFGTAEHAAVIADRRIADYPGTLRYHLFIDDFVHTAHDLDELVR